MAVGVPIPINHSFDMTVGFSLHNYIAPPTPTVIVPWTPTIEFPIFHWWPPGVGAGTVKKTTTVMYQGSFAIIQEGHDVGPFIPQMTIPQPNVWNLVFPVKSKRKVMFQSFYNRMDKKQVGLTNLIPIPLPMMACGEPISWPLTLPIYNFIHNVKVGLTVADFVGGWVNIILTMATEYLISRIWPGKNAAGEDITRTGMKKVGENLGSALLGVVAGTASTYVQHLIDPNYPIKIDFSVNINSKTKVGVSTQFGSADTTNNPSSVTGTASYKFAENKKTGSEASTTGSAQWTWDAGDKKTSEGVTGTAGVSGKSPVASGKHERTASYNPHNTDAQGRDNSVSFGQKTEGQAPGVSGSTSQTYNPNAPAGESTTTTTSGTAGGNTHTTTTAPNATGPGNTTTTTSTSGGSSTTTTTNSGPFGRPL